MAQAAIDACAKVSSLRRAGRRCALVLLACVASALCGADAPPAPAKAVPATARPEPSPAERLAMTEQAVADKYQHLEEVLLRMAELTAVADPRRAALLKKAVALGKDRLVGARFERLVDLLGKDQLAKALETDAQLDQDLRALLELLMSENRAKRIESEKARMREYLRQINNLIKQEKDLQGRTLGGNDPKKLAGEQGKVADRTGELAETIRKNEEPKGAEKPKGEGGRGTAERGKPKAEDKKPKAESGKEKAEAEKTEEEEGKNPARGRLDEARARMKDAQAKLDEAQRQGAADKQEEAIRELQQAKAKLEQILRQLREEEVARSLAMLESRFRKMLQLQEEVYEATKRLDKVPAAERTHSHEIEASRQSGKQSEIVVELDKAILLLRDDGSAAAFLEAAGQLRDDMRQIVDRLARANVGSITQGIEEDALASLREMIEALKRARKDQDKKQPQGRPSQDGPQESPLVDALAELRMIRALQVRVNTRTARYAALIEGEQADNSDVIEALRRLADRQEQIRRVTHDLETGRNQ